MAELVNCLDTYVLMEIEQGNTSLLYLFDQEIVIPSPIMAEFYNLMLRKNNKKTADYWFNHLKSLVKEIDLDIWIDSIIFREKNKKQKLSLYDSLAYIFAQKNNYFFVTGDKEFKTKKGVKFIS